MKSPIPDGRTLLALGVALLGAPALAAPSVFGESAMVKVRPSTPVKAGAPVMLTAARNEFVSFQVVIHGGGSGAPGVSATLPALTGPGGATLGGTDVTLYREAFLNIVSTTPPNTQTGPWPDPLLPDVDELAGERRSAFPFDVPANQARAIWVDVHVPFNAPPGPYLGAVNVTGSGLSAQVPVAIEVVDITMPSTPSLATAFLLYGPNVCTAHLGSYDCGGVDGQIALVGRYQKMALEHRLTLSNPFAWMPSSDWTAFDAAYAPYLDGTVTTRLPGARMTSAQYPGARTAAGYAAFAAHFKAKGWLDRAYDYTADEPPYGASFAEALSRAQFVRASAPALRTLITTSQPIASQYGLLPYTDVIVPVVNFLDGAQAPYLGDQRGTYDAHLTEPGNALWVYQSCMSQGCAYGSTLPEVQAGSGWPSYMVDASAARNRAMQWVDFRERVSGELYYETALALSTAWTDQYRYNGNGDGTLFYPGTPSAIGGTTHIPVASIRLKMIRLGIQDHEWLKMVSDAGDPAFARAVAASVFNSSHQVGDDGAVLEKARTKLIERLVALRAPATDGGTGTPPDAGQPPLDAGCGCTGDGGIADAGTAPGGDAGTHADGGGLSISGRALGCSRGGAQATLFLGAALLGVVVLRPRRRGPPDGPAQSG